MCTDPHTHTQALSRARAAGTGPELWVSGEHSRFMPACLFPPHPVARGFWGARAQSWSPGRVTNICLGLSDISTKNPVCWEPPRVSGKPALVTCPRPQAGLVCIFPPRALLTTCHLSAGQGSLGREPRLSLYCHPGGLCTNKNHYVY